MVAISNNPNYPFFKRKVDSENVRIIIDCKNQYVVLDLDVYNFSQEEILIQDIPVKTVTLRATNDTLVNEQGVPSENGVIGEFDFFLQMMGVPVVINDLILAKIAWADSVQKFD